MGHERPSSEMIQHHITGIKPGSTGQMGSQVPMVPQS